MKNKLAICAVWGLTVSAISYVGFVGCSSATPTDEQAKRLTREELASFIDDAAHATGVPEVVLAAIVERDSDFGDPQQMYEFYEEWAKDAKASPQYAELSDEELKNAVALHGFAKVSGQVAKTFCNAPHNLMYSPVDNLVCAGRFLRKKIEYVKSQHDLSPSLTLWWALTLYNKEMTPNPQLHEAEAQFYADCIMARIGGMLLDVKATYDSRVAHSLMTRKRATITLKNCKDKRCSVEIIGDGIGARFQSILNRVLGTKGAQ